MAMAMLKPTAIELVETLFTPHKLEIQLEELRISERSPMANKPAKDFFGHRLNDVKLVAIIRDGDTHMSPDFNDLIQTGDVLVLIGAKEQLRKIEAIAS